MRHCWIFALILVLPACDMAGPGFRGEERVKREFEGSRFTLRFSGDMAEAIRTSPEFLPRFEVIARKAGLLAQAETGCKVAWVQGDPSMQLMGLACDGRKAPRQPRRKRGIECYVFDAFASAAGGSALLDCYKG